MSFKLLKNGRAALVAAAICVATAPSPSLAETHALQPYAYVQAHGVNRVDTGYCAKPLSRYFLDFQLENATVKNQGLLGENSSSASVKCAFYITKNNPPVLNWYYYSSTKKDANFGAIDPIVLCWGHRKWSNSNVFRGLRENGPSPKR